MTPAEKIADLEGRLIKAREFYVKNQREIADLKQALDDIAYVTMGEGERETVSQHPALESVKEAILDGHHAVSIAGTFRQWCRLVIQAASKPEFSHLLSDSAWEAVLTGIEADLDAEAQADRERGLPI